MNYKFTFIILIFVFQNCNNKLANNQEPQIQKLPKSIYSIHDQKVYSHNKELSMADYKSFVVIGGICHTDEADLKCFAKDKNNVYYHGRPLPSADPDSFVFFGYVYMRDKTKVYYIYDNKNVVVEGADSSSFEILGTAGEGPFAYAKDKNYVYYDGERLHGVKAKNFDLKKVK